MSKADAFLDITDVVCPMTFVKAKVAIEGLDVGQTLEIHMNGGEPIQNVPRSMKDEGHKVLDVQTNDNGTFNIVVQKSEEPA